MENSNETGDGSRRICPEHGLPDCSPLLNGCPRLTLDPDVIVCWRPVPCSTVADHRCARPYGHSGSHRCRRWLGGMCKRDTPWGMADLCEVSR